MVSGIKNFFLTFVLAAVIFGLVAAAVLTVVINNINGVLAPEREVPSSAIDPTQKDEPSITTQTRFSVLVIGSDYRDGVYADYDPDQLLSLFGIRKKTVSEPLAPTDAMVPSAKQARKVFSDKDLEKDTVSYTEDGQPVIPGGFYSVKMRSVEADICMVVTFRFDTMTVECSPLDTTRVIEVKGGSMPMSELLGKYGVVVFVDAVRSILNMPIDRYLFVAAKDYPAFQDAFGNVTYSVPADLQCDDYLRDVHTNLSAGSQVFDGASALDLLLFDAYDSVILSRKTTVADYTRCFLAAVFSSDNAKNVVAEARTVKKLVQTDITAADLEENLSRFAACAALVS